MLARVPSVGYLPEAENAPVRGTKGFEAADVDRRATAHQTAPYVARRGHRRWGSGRLAGRTAHSTAGAALRRRRRRADLW